MIDRLLGNDWNRGTYADDWSHAESTAETAMKSPGRLTNLVEGSGDQRPLSIMNLLSSYDPASCHVTVFPPVIARAAVHLGVEQRALANVAFMHASVYAIAHLGRDLDGRHWSDFGLPPARDINYKPSLLLETLARAFSFKLPERLNDPAMTTAFERIGEQQPLEYQVWRRLRSQPVEELRKILMRARAGLDGILPFESA